MNRRKQCYLSGLDFEFLVAQPFPGGHVNTAQCCQNEGYPDSGGTMTTLPSDPSASHNPWRSLLIYLFKHPPFMLSRVSYSLPVQVSRPRTQQWLLWVKPWFLLTDFSLSIGWWGPRGPRRWGGESWYPREKRTGSRRCPCHGLPADTRTGNVCKWLQDTEDQIGWASQQLARRRGGITQSYSVSKRFCSAGRLHSD